MNQLELTLDKIFSKYSLIKGFISNKREKNQEYDKIKIRPVLVKTEVRYQIEYFIDTKVIHKNLNAKEAIEELTNMFINNFKQGEFITKEKYVFIRFSKKDKLIISEKRNKDEDTKELSIKHNETKNYIIGEGRPVDFLIHLGIMTKEGKVKANKYKKFRQINRYVEIIDDIIREDRLLKDEINVVDFGCGKSYLTFALYYYLRKIKNYKIHITGIDLKEDVVNHCNSIARELNYNGLNFVCGDISNFNLDKEVHMVISLHACDTATDFALGKAVDWKSQIILAVPCCQHEINNQISNSVLSSMLEYGIIKERFSALLTDSLRALLLKSKGYNVQMLEFIDLEHTPKNILIKAIRSELEEKEEALREYIKLKDFFNVNPSLEEIISK